MPDNSGSVVVVLAEQPDGEFGVGVELLDKEEKIAWAYLDVDLAVEVAENIKFYANAAKSKNKSKSKKRINKEKETNKKQ
jgi:hypothetical protein